MNRLIATGAAIGAAVIAATPLTVGHNLVWHQQTSAWVFQGRSSSNSSPRRNQRFWLWRMC